MQTKKVLPEQFKKALHVIANGVFVVSAQHDGKVRGFTATWVSQVSYEHRFVMVSASKEHDTYPFIVDSKTFVVNVLSASNVNLARYFGSAKRPDEPMELGYFRKEDGSPTPVLADAMAYLKCKVVSTLDIIDHTIFVGEIEDAQVLRDEPPLIYYRRKGYVTLAPNRG